MERHNEVLNIRYPYVKNNKKCGGTTIINIRDKNYMHDRIVLQTQSDLKDFDSIEIKDRRSDCIERQINIKRENIVRRSETNSRNKVPESCKLALRSSARKTELISECLKKTSLDCTPKTVSRKELLSPVKCDKPGTSSVKARDIDSLATSRDSANVAHNLCREDNVHLINYKNVPDKNKKAEQNFQRGKINDDIVSNNLSRLTRGNIVKHQETKKIENGTTALPAKPTRSLPLKTSVENNDGKKSRLAKVKSKLSNSTQSFAEKIPSAVDSDPKSMEGAIIKQQISSHEDTGIQKTVSEETNENNNLQNEAVRQNTSEMNVKNDERNQLPVIPNIKRKRGRPRKTIDNFADQSTADKSKDTSKEISDTIAESMTRDKRRTNKINIIDINDLSDESDIAEDKIFIKKRGRPSSRGRGGKRRGRGRGRGTSQSSLDTEYIPRSTAKDTSATAAHVANIENVATDSETPNTNKVVGCNIL